VAFAGIYDFADRFIFIVCSGFTYPCTRGYRDAVRTVDRDHRRTSNPPAATTESCGVCANSAAAQTM
jgi:hypothetical protein